VLKCQASRVGPGESLGPTSWRPLDVFNDRCYNYIIRIQQYIGSPLQHRAGCISERRFCYGYKEYRKIQGDTDLNDQVRPEEYDLSQVYIRRAILKGDLPAKKVPISEGATTVRNEFTEKDFLHWRSTRKTRSRRTDGRSKYVHYATDEEELELQALLTKNELNIIVQRANKRKPKKAVATASK